MIKSTPESKQTKFTDRQNDRDKTTNYRTGEQNPRITRNEDTSSKRNKISSKYGDADTQYDYHQQGNTIADTMFGTDSIKQQGYSEIPTHFRDGAGRVYIPKSNIDRRYERNTQHRNVDLEYRNDDIVNDMKIKVTMLDKQTNRFRKKNQRRREAKLLQRIHSLELAESELEKQRLQRVKLQKEIDKKIELENLREQKLKLLKTREEELALKVDRKDRDRLEGRDRNRTEMKDRDSYGIRTEDRCNEGYTYMDRYSDRNRDNDIYNDRQRFHETVIDRNRNMNINARQTSDNIVSDYSGDNVTRLTSGFGKPNSTIRWYRL
ncbi:nuclear speckle splicing regulatory protein 1-like [Mercenaria mercenaria]|uniref:nuclear speckle splicing regulatory protein 1-like n=1 Tax=Mercenaria mercenaria TaxID=6596 RepID=UPI00234E8A0D|nr:nuclear speckle splicing regulatory protein 1-like [Mercenaria mercenaria]